MVTEYKFDAFISYRHTDSNDSVTHTSRLLRRFQTPKSANWQSNDSLIAEQLQHLLETYVPQKYLGIKKKELSIFLDKSEMATGGNLPEKIHQHLEESRYLIVICSPILKDSSYCLDEIRYFKKLHAGSLNNILIVLTEGEPQEVFPDELLYELCQETDLNGNLITVRRFVDLQFCDIRSSKHNPISVLKKKLLQLIAPLYDGNYDDFVLRSEKRKRRKKRLAISIFTLILCILSVGICGEIQKNYVIYQYEAQNNMDEKDYAKALLYYSKMLQINPFNDTARTNAMILLQQNTWPYLTEYKKDYTIFDSTIFPNTLSEYYVAALSSSGTSALCRKPQIDFTDWYILDTKTGESQQTLSKSDIGYYYNIYSSQGYWTFHDEKKKHYTFYEQKTGRCYSFPWSAYSEYRPDICLVSSGHIVLNNNKELSIIDFRTGIKKRSAVFTSLFPEDIFQKHSIEKEAFFENMSTYMWASPDGKLLAVEASIYMYDDTNITLPLSITAILSADTLEVLFVTDPSEYVLSSVTFDPQGNYIALLYENDALSAVHAQPGGYAEIYDRKGNLIFYTEPASTSFPYGAAFYTNALLLWDSEFLHFWDLNKREKYAVSLPLEERIKELIFTEEEQFAFTTFSGTFLYKLVKFEGPSYTLPDSVTAIELDNNLIMTLTNEYEISLCDQSGTLLDRFVSDTKLISIGYDPEYSFEAVFLFDQNLRLYWLPIHLEEQKFLISDLKLLAESVNAYYSYNNHLFLYRDFGNEVQCITAGSSDSCPNYMKWRIIPKTPAVFQDFYTIPDSTFLILVFYDKLQDQTTFELRDIQKGTYISSFTINGKPNNTLSPFYIDGSIPNRKTIQNLRFLSGYQLDKFKNTIAETNSINLENFGNWNQFFIPIEQKLLLP